MIISGREDNKTENEDFFTGSMNWKRTGGGGPRENKELRDALNFWIRWNPLSLSAVP